MAASSSSVWTLISHRATRCALLHNYIQAENTSGKVEWGQFTLTNWLASLTPHLSPHAFLRRQTGNWCNQLTNHWPPETRSIWRNRRGASRAPAAPVQSQTAMSAKMRQLPGNSPPGGSRGSLDVLARLFSSPFLGRRWSLWARPSSLSLDDSLRWAVCLSRPHPPVRLHNRVGACAQRRYDVGPASSTATQRRTTAWWAADCFRPWMRRIKTAAQSATKSLAVLVPAPRISPTAAGDWGRHTTQGSPGPHVTLHFKSPRRCSFWHALPVRTLPVPRSISSPRS